MKLKVIILHGLNNTVESFYPLRDGLQSKGLECVILQLPGHRNVRDENIQFDSAQREFDNCLSPHTRSPYVVVAFSLGALYFQLWLQKDEVQPPHAQVLLAPALNIRRQDLVHKILGALWKGFPLPSQTPPKLRLYPFLCARDYGPLIQGQKIFKGFTRPFRLPTMILADPKDEVIDLEGLQKHIDQLNLPWVTMKLFERKYLMGKRPGKYHVLFHPDYFRPDDWDRFMEMIGNFLLKASVGA